MANYFKSQQKMVFDGKRMRKAIQRKTIDFTTSFIRESEARVIYGDEIGHVGLQPFFDYIPDLLPPFVLPSETSITSKFTHTSTNKVRCPVNTLSWTPEGRRVIAGSSSGEFTLWNGFTFNFETILQAHDQAVRSMAWSHNDNWMVSGDHNGVIKYWQLNMNNVKAFQAHQESVRAISFAPTDLKFASGSDDVKIKIWDFALCKEEQSLEGHGWDVKCVKWHPFKSLIASGAKDTHIKLWDPKSGKNIQTLHGHKAPVLRTEWSLNGNMLLTSSRDQLLKLFDLRTMKEFQTFKGHKKEVNSCTWHPIHDDLIVSGSADGAIIFWLTENEAPYFEIQAHESSVWDLAFHPVGHILVTCSNDHTTKFWARGRPGETASAQAISKPFDVQSFKHVPSYGGDQQGPNHYKGTMDRGRKH